MGQSSSDYSFPPCPPRILRRRRLTGRRARTWQARRRRMGRRARTWQAARRRRPSVRSPLRRRQLLAGQRHGAYAAMQREAPTAGRPLRVAVVDGPQACRCSGFVRRGGDRAPEDVRCGRSGQPCVGGDWSREPVGFLGREKYWRTSTAESS